MLMTLVSVASPALALDNSQFAVELDGAKPVLWQEYEPLRRDFVSCIAGLEPRRLTHPLCAQLNERRGRMLWDALKQAVWLNISSPGGQGFCAEHATKIVFDQDAVEGSTIAGSMVDLQLRGAAGPYGADLPVTYLGKIVYDALVKISPCRQ
jgi:hypothetical protein